MRWGVGIVEKEFCFREVGQKWWSKVRAENAMDALRNLMEMFEEMEAPSPPTVAVKPKARFRCAPYCGRLPRWRPRTT